MVATNKARSDRFLIEKMQHLIKTQAGFSCVLVEVRSEPDKWPWWEVNIV